MRVSIRNALFLLLASAILVFALNLHFRTNTRKTPGSVAINSLPPVILWAWERPEHLGFIDPHKVGVAFLAQTISLRGPDVLERPRQQTLETPAGTRLVAVVRVESDKTVRPTLDIQQATRTADKITKLMSSPSISAIQIDFDATESERQFYRSLLAGLRQRLPASVALSITALASWCAGDDWISDLPIDEAVPMLFRMGVEKQQFKSRIISGRKFTSALCQSAAGVATDEIIAIPPVKRLYIFNSGPWSKSSFITVMEAYQK
ncbi:MAG: DUF3142 domain-containing protein [Pyrinomonadaceae bacterium]